MQILKKCIKCNKEFFIYPYRINQAKYCSKECKAVYKKRECQICRKVFRPKSPGITKYCSQICYGISERGRSPWNKGIKATEDERIKKFVDAGHEAIKGQIPWNKGKTWGNSNWLRKNNPNLYRSIHKRIYKKFGSSDKCEHCGIVGNNRKIHWANVDAKYIEEKRDWKRLCVACHIKFDKSNKKKNEV